MKKFIKQLKNYSSTNRIAKNILMITGGSIFAQGITIILSPFITRIYSPENYGILSLYSAILGMVSLLGALCYNNAIVIAEKDEEAVNILILCFSLIIGTTVILFSLLYLKGNIILEIFKAQKLISYKYFIPFGFFMNGIYTVFSSWIFRKKNFKAITASKYIQSTTGNSIKILLGLLKFNSIGLILGSLCNIVSGTITLGYSSFKEIKILLKFVNKSTILKVGLRYKNFPLYSFPGLLLLSVSGQISTVFISSMYGPKETGLFGLAMGITFLPMGIIGKSVQDVFYAEAAGYGKKNPEEIKKLSLKLLKKLAMLAILPMIVLMWQGPFLFSFVFGEKWLKAGIYSRYLSIYVFAHFMIHPTSVVFSILEKQKYSFVLSASKLLIVLLAFNISNLFKLSPIQAVLIYSLGMGLTEIFKLFLTQKVLNEEIKNKNAI